MASPVWFQKVMMKVLSLWVVMEQEVGVAVMVIPLALAALVRAAEVQQVIWV